MRIRTVKPEFWTNKKMATQLPMTRLVALALLNYCDDEGYFLNDFDVIKGSLFPFSEDSVSIQGALKALLSLDYIRVKTLKNGESIGRIVSFKKHQYINRPSKCIYKALWEQEKAFSEDSVSIQGALSGGSGMEVEVEVEVENSLFADSGDENGEPEIKPKKKIEKVREIKKSEKQIKNPENKNCFSDWIDVNREFNRADPLPSGPVLAAAKRIAEIIPNSDERKKYFRGFLQDNVSFVVDNGHRLQDFEGRIEKYRNPSREKAVSRDADNITPEENSKFNPVRDINLKRAAENKRREAEKMKKNPRWIPMYLIRGEGGLPGEYTHISGGFEAPESCSPEILKVARGEEITEKTAALYNSWLKQYKNDNSAVFEVKTIDF